MTIRQSAVGGALGFTAPLLVNDGPGHVIAIGSDTQSSTLVLPGVDQIVVEDTGGPSGALTFVSSGISSCPYLVFVEHTVALSAGSNAWLEIWNGDIAGPTPPVLLSATSTGNSTDIWIATQNNGSVVLFPGNGAASTGLVDFHYAATALGGGAAPTLGTIGGSGPTTAAQKAWLAIKVDGTPMWMPVWV